MLLIWCIISITPILSFAEFTPIIEGEIDVGNRSKSVSHILNFNVDKVSEEAKLEVQFKVKTAGSCPNTYESTTFFLNGDNFAELDFRKYELGEDKKVVLDIPEETLVVGKNKLEIITGECKFGVDSMTLQSISVQ